MTETHQKRRRGRPPTGQMPKHYFRMNDANWAQIVAAAKSREESISDYIRRVLLANARRVLKKD